MFNFQRAEGEALSKFKNKPLLCYPKFNDAIRTLEITYAMSDMNERACLTTGVPGVGKSTIAETVNHHFNVGYEASRPRSVYVKLDSPKTLKDFTEQISNGVVSLRKKVSKTELKQQLQRALLSQGVEVLILDEIQTLLPAKKESSLARDMADAIKHLMEQCNLCVFMFGVEDENRLYDAEKYKKFTIGQLVSRSNATVRLSNFKNDNDWKAVLSYLNKHVYLPKEITLIEPDIADLIFEATKGNFRDLNNIIACCHAMYDLELVTSLNIKTLAIAFREVISKEPGLNPFVQYMSNKELVGV